MFAVWINESKWIRNGLVESCDDNYSAKVFKGAEEFQILCSPLLHLRSEGGTGVEKDIEISNKL